jgi:excisionase family DNA binding protein
MAKLYKVEEVAAMLNISNSYVYKNAEIGKIGCFKIGTALRFSEENINDYLEKCTSKKAEINPISNNI